VKKRCYQFEREKILLAHSPCGCRIILLKINDQLTLPVNNKGKKEKGEKEKGRKAEEHKG